MKRGKTVICEGLIGAGKSSFSEILAETFGGDTLLLIEPDERDNSNPYLGDYYEDAKRWSFTMQMHLLSLRYRMHLQAQWYAMNTRNHAVVDRSIMGDTAFARVQVKDGLMTEREFQTYTSLYHAMTASVLLPNVCIHLQVDPKTSLHRISKRMEERTGRVCEVAVSSAYLESLDREITHMVAVLEQQGTRVLRVDWNKERTHDEIRAAVETIAREVNEYQVPDLFLDLHRRTI